MWSGTYIGAHIGYGWGEADYALQTPEPVFAGPADAAADSAAGSRNVSLDGMIGGLQLGHNKQINGWVVGIEADVTYAGFAKSSRVDALLPVANVTGTIVSTTDVEWTASIRPRIGVVSGPLMVFATAGIAIADFAFTQHQSATGIAAFERAAASEVRVGWTVGGGAELALGGAWTLKADYLYSDYGTASAVGFASGGFPQLPFNHDSQLTMHAVRTGLNYRF